MILDLFVSIPLYYTFFCPSILGGWQYIIWMEDGGGVDTWADDVCTYQTITGTIDYFTRVEDDPNVERIQHALNNGNIVWRLNSVQYEKDTKYKHYEWEWEVTDSGEI